MGDRPAARLVERFAPHGHIERRLADFTSKDAVVAKLLSVVADPPLDRDERIAAIRAAMERRFGPGIDFYDTIAVNASNAFWQLLDATDEGEDMRRNYSTGRCSSSPPLPR